MLGMPMWSVTEERVEALIEEMRKKKQAREDLEKKDVHTLWVEDLDAFEETLTKHEAQEEADRLAHGVKNSEGGRKGRKGAKKGAGAKKPAAVKGSPRPKKGVAKTQGKLDFNEKSKTIKPKEKDPSEMSLKERMAARFGKDIPMK